MVTNQFIKQIKRHFIIAWKKTYIHWLKMTSLDYMRRQCEIIAAPEWVREKI